MNRVVTTRARAAVAAALTVAAGAAIAVVVVTVHAARAAWAVLVLLLSAADALVTAWLGVRPAGLWLSTMRRELADEARRGWHDAIDADVVEEIDGMDDDPDDDSAVSVLVNGKGAR
ncbi:hypothetical protein [Actinomadura terrae]|uniref:hypothetical protein n=1 Tax=Actinomadura terrae TaxID=604353 RepID=UPI001FA7F82B|nr:hypothetical protein [Actinomadura terrae]